MENNQVKINYNLKNESPIVRVANVQEVIDNTPPEKLTPAYLSHLADFILGEKTVEERKSANKILTKNRTSVINSRETSFEGLVSKLENGEDGIYNMITSNNHIILDPKSPITQEEIDSIPPLANLIKDIKATEEKLRKLNAAGRGKSKEASLLWTQLIQMRKDQYEVKSIFNPPIRCMHLIKNFARINLEDKIHIDEETGKAVNDGFVSFFDPKHISAILCNYSKLKEDSWEMLASDAKWLIEDFEKLVDDTLKEKYPLYYDIVIYKIDGRSNAEIQLCIERDYGIKHSVEYISSLWRNKIPKLIAETAENQFYEWYYTYKEKGKWKRCSRCGQIKLAHNNFFSKNKTSKDGWYSICKECRNKKKRG